MSELCEKCGGPLPTPEQWERGACGQECDACVRMCWGGIQCTDERHRALVKHGSSEAIQRAKFEAWVSAEPRLYVIRRRGVEEIWYEQIEVQLAWEAWQEARK